MGEISNSKPLLGTGGSVLGAAWPEADRLFKTDSRWLGSDDAYSVELGPERTLWLFGDTFVGDGASLSRRDAAFPRNTVGIQQGTDPAHSTIRFYWREDSGLPSSLFPTEPRDHWLWPLHGARIGDALLLFFMKVRSPSSSPESGPLDEWRDLGPLGFFDVYDWEAIVVLNPDADPSEWRCRIVEHQGGTEGIILGAAVVVTDETLMAFGWKDREGYLARWPLERALKADLRSPQWWDGDGWDEDVAAAAVVLSPVRTECTVHFDRKSSIWIHTQTGGEMGTSITQRWAEQIVGPWSEPSTLFVPEETERPGVMIYAAKAHPQLDGADLVVTYASNGRDVDETLTDMSIYYPRFVKITRATP